MFSPQPDTACLCVIYDINPTTFFATLLQIIFLNALEIGIRYTKGQYRFMAFAHQFYHTIDLFRNIKILEKTTTII